LQLAQIQTRFQAMSETIISRIDAMSERVEGLERSIGDLMATSSPAAAATGPLAAAAAQPPATAARQQ